MNIGIYTITNLLNNKIYVGSTFNKFNKRWNQHISLLRNNDHSNRHLQLSFNKYGEENFKFEVLEELDKDLILLFEQYWINLLEVTNPKYGYNKCLFVGKNNKGRKQSLEHLEKNRIKSIGFKHSNKTIEKLKIIALERRDKGQLGYWKNKKRSKEDIEKIVSKKIKAIIQLDLEDNIIKEWSSLIQAERLGNFNSRLICQCCKGNRNKHAGYKWRYKKK